MIVDGHFFIFQDVFMPTRKCVISGEYINNLNKDSFIQTLFPSEYFLCSSEFVLIVVYDSHFQAKNATPAD